MGNSDPRRGPVCGGPISTWRRSKSRVSIRSTKSSKGASQSIQFPLMGAGPLAGAMDVDQEDARTLAISRDKDIVSRSFEWPAWNARR